MTYIFLSNRISLYFPVIRFIYYRLQCSFVYAFEAISKYLQRQVVIDSSYNISHNKYTKQMRKEQQIIRALWRVQMVVFDAYDIKFSRFHTNLLAVCIFSMKKWSTFTTWLCVDTLSNFQCWQIYLFLKFCFGTASKRHETFRSSRTKRRLWQFFYLWFV